MRAVVGIPTLIRYDLLERCIESVLNSSYVPARVIVVDSGGGYAGSHRHVEIVRPPRTLGVSEAWNYLHTLAAPAPLVLLNDDCIIGRPVLAELLRQEAPGVVSAIEGRHAWSAFLQREPTWQQVGEYDEHFQHYLGDSDYRLRLRMHGLPLITVPGLPVQHVGSATIKVHDERQYNMFHSEVHSVRGYFIHKWGCLPDCLGRARLPRFATDETTRAVAGKTFDYRRLGIDSRPLELREDFTIGAGSADMERYWWAYKNRLVIFNYGTATCTLRRQNNMWRGRWRRFEKCPVELEEVA